MTTTISTTAAATAAAATPCCQRDDLRAGWGQEQSSRGAVIPNAPVAPAVLKDTGTTGYTESEHVDAHDTCGCPL
jgi:hypothetical protein